MAIPTHKFLEMEQRHKFIPLPTSSSTSPADPPVISPPQLPDENVPRKGPDLRTLSRRFYKIASPYWFSDDKVQARTRLAIVFALTLGTTGINVGFNFLGRDFYNALADKDQAQFKKQLLYYIGAFAGGIPIFVIKDYARDTLALRWRAWMTKYYLEGYLKNQTFYQIQTQSLVDNPDQRIVDDLGSFTETSLSFSLTLFNALLDLVSFSNILYSIYPPLFGVLLVYSIAGTAISIFLGKGLVNLNFLQEKMEADFRYGLVRVRENAESIAFYGGEENEFKLLLQIFRRAFENFTQLLISTRNLEFFTSSYRHLIQILPAAVVAPMYFAGKIEFGVITQSVSAFNHILGDFSLIVYEFQAISAFSAVIERLGEFDDVLDYTSSNDPLEPFDEIQLTYINVKDSPFLLSKTPSGAHKLLEIESLSVQTPTNKALLIRDLSLTVCNNEHLLVTGPSGTGKTSLLRAIAGLWRAGRGKITFYAKHTLDVTAPNESSKTVDIHNDDKRSKYRDFKGVFFLPQRPYMVLGTLRQQLLYPTWPSAQDSAPRSSMSNGLLPFFEDAPRPEVVSAPFLPPNTNDLIKALEDVCLGYLVSRFSGLDTINEWSSVLSLGEQQRLAFARLLLSRPDLVLLDESTSALDEANEAHLYEKVNAAGITYISIGHRTSLGKFHKKALQITPIHLESKQPNWSIKESPVFDS
ncbi:putative ABC-type fatty-acyl-CoA transporter [Helianthus annuus]|uniref:Fatty-acyl-CoA-transporting ATPase n=1 Tax=Helianthus annuus TaxID=4232 RepID=A0A251UAS7_HELAN|nr:ABC transporter D family member 2, chloroplastic [Helianthus annuus]KAF5803426.1 putative fatty-acyl-CoA-transporting ATPase [Helianthus annuus]KAJ0561384.1 putative ABC-type fatty-acyl-CoA transporter [Helianthus annuus]KAJ0568004.1 putative ABC-type fatty-acyl-CoA transporter [Helianthus annuus]KAJ0574437.1 putative ABC-type fatty-acyl-CoA transporter [Helianthus annuus]KAJ0738773.1 putative ABC-type fatty-acyl-CoA transporter [Helianthus annuus]